MNAIGKRRLLKLADFLETADLPGKFDMHLWGDGVTGTAPSCGSVACAAGWATTIPAFKKAGLHLVKTKWLFQETQPAIGRRRGMRALQFFFSLSENQARDIFSGGSGPAKGKPARRAVAKIIRRIVAKGT